MTRVQTRPNPEVFGLIRRPDVTQISDPISCVTTEHVLKFGDHRPSELGDWALKKRKKRNY